MNNQSTDSKESRLKKVLLMASAHEGCSAVAIQRDENDAWVAMTIFGVHIIFDVQQKPEFDVFVVHALDWLPMPSAEMASDIANHINSKLAVAKVVAQDGCLGVYAHEFALKDGIPSEENLKRLIDVVRLGIAIVLERCEGLEKTSACPEPILN